MNEFQLTLTNYTARQGMSISELAKRVGYDPLLFEKIVIGKNRQIPVNFFIRIADVLNLTTGEKDSLVRSWAFGVERWNWPQRYESHQRRPAKRKAG
jgi:transcriptional regulator with XRE-family HTH domain